MSYCSCIYPESHQHICVSYDALYGYILLCIRHLLTLFYAEWTLRLDCLPMIKRSTSYSMEVTEGVKRHLNLMTTNLFTLPEPPCTPSSLEVLVIRDLPLALEHQTDKDEDSQS